MIDPKDIQQTISGALRDLDKFNVPKVRTCFWCFEPCISRNAVRERNHDFCCVKHANNFIKEWIENNFES